MKNNFLNKMIIVSYLTLLLFHFLVGRRYKIYPSLVFPAFSYAPVVTDKVQYPDFLFYAITSRNQLVIINKEQFFNGYKYHVNQFLTTIVSNEQKFKHKPSLLMARAAFITYSMKRLKKLYPEQSFTGLQIDKILKTYHTKNMAFGKNINIEPGATLYFNH